jgi:integrase
MPLWGRGVVKFVAPLTVAQIKAAAAGRRLADGLGLYFEIRESKAGRYAYGLFRYQATGGKRREYGIGVLDTGSAASRGGFSLVEIRDKAQDLCRAVRSGGDPVADRQHQKKVRLAAALVPAETPTFAEALKRFVRKEKAGWTSVRYAESWARAVEDHAKALLPLRVDMIDPQIVAKALDPSWQSKPVTAGKVRARVEAVFYFCTAQRWRAGDNPASLDVLRHMLTAPAAEKLMVKHMAAIDWRQVGDLMVALERVSTVGSMAARFTILTAARAEETRGATWGEVNLSDPHAIVLQDEDGREYRDTAGARWDIPAKRMKSRRPHVVPLCAETLAILRIMRDGYSNVAASDPVFPGRTGKSLMDIGAMRYALKAAGFEGLTMHGVARSTFRDWVSEATSHDRILAEHALGHRVGDSTERAYARSVLLARRRTLMAEWGRFATRPLKQAEGGNVLALQSAAAAG